MPGRALADREWTTLMRVAEPLLIGSPVQVPPARVADNVEQFLITGRSRRAFRVRVLLNLLEWLPVASYGSTFSQLSTLERQQLLEDKLIPGKHLWGVCAKVRLLILMGIYGDSATMASLGLSPRDARKRAERLADTIVAHQLIQLHTGPERRAH